MQGKTQFDEFLAQEVQESRQYFPVKTGFLHRMLIRKADCFNLHPNPEDEFCMPNIGPNYGIISDYQQQFLNAKKNRDPFYTAEPLVVERTYPSGYRIINGHHRWAAALRIGQTHVPIQIVNLMHGEDVKRVLENSTHSKRAALDLDEVVFSTGTDIPLESPLPFPWNKMYPERVRAGIPALFHCLSEKGYDIWLYSAKYYSTDSIQNHFRRYHATVDGVITATEKRTESAGERGETLDKMITDKYQSTVHIDDRSVMQIIAGSKSLREFPLSGSPETWSQEVMDAIEEIESAEGSEST